MSEKQTGSLENISFNQLSLGEQENYAIFTLPEELGDTDEIYKSACHAIKQLNKGPGIVFGWKIKTFKEVFTEGHAIPAESEGVDVSALQTITDYCVQVAAEKLGFSEDAQINVLVGSEGKREPYQVTERDGTVITIEPSNVNENIHRDGIGGPNFSAFEDGKVVKSVRFIYAIDREGTLLFPGLLEEGSPVSQSMGDASLVKDPTDDEQMVNAKFLSDNKEESINKAYRRGQANQILPGRILAFDMTNSPWHSAPVDLNGGATMTVNIFEHSEK